MRKRQRGVALLTAILLVALATVLSAELAFENVLSVRRSASMQYVDKAMMYALGGEAWAALILRQDATESSTDHLAEEWAIPLPPLPLERGEIVEGTLEGLIEDLQSRFNVNNLISADGVVDEVAVEQFQRLLENLSLDPRWAQALVDWIDLDIEPLFPDGAEDPAYTGQLPPYRTANGPITSISELLALPGMDQETYAALRPHVAALPVGTTVNLCTASCEVLNALVAGVNDLCVDTEALSEDRTEQCAPNRDELEARLTQDELELIQDYASESSRYFRAVGRVTIGTSQFTLYSLLERDPAGVVRPVARSFGTE